MKNHRRSSALRTYFTKRNLRFSNSINADIARYKISLIFDKLKHNSEQISHFEIVLLLKNNKSSLETLLNYYKRTDLDNRSGAESYGFNDWEYNLLYVSDRFACRFRLQWILDLCNHLILDEVAS